MFEQVDVWSTVPNVVQRKQQESKTMTWKNTHQTKNGNARTDEATDERQTYTKKWSNIYTYSYFYNNHCRAEVFS